MRRSVLQFILLITVSGLSINFSYAKNDAGIRSAWNNLDRTMNQCDDIYDYHPQGGMRIFYCHIKAYYSYQDLVKASHIPVFRKGPHTRDKLSLQSRYDFGYYNKDFVSWLKDYVIVASREPMFRQSTQDLYDKYVKPLATTYHRTFKELSSDPQYYRRETDKYLQLIETKSLGEYYAEDFYEFKDLYKQGYNGNVVKTAVLFWFRRNIDGTKNEFSDALDVLVQSYNH